MTGACACACVSSLGPPGTTCSLIYRGWNTERPVHYRMNALTSRPGTPPDSDLISLAEPETEVLQVLHPDVTVSILVTHVENLLESPQKLQQLLLVGKNASFHFSLVRTFVPPSNVNQLLKKRLSAPPPSRSSAPVDRLVPPLLQ